MNRPASVEVSIVESVAWSPVRVSNVELLKLFVLVPKNDNLIPDLTLTILLRCFAAAGILPLSRTAYQGAYI